MVVGGELTERRRRRKEFCVRRGFCRDGGAARNDSPAAGLGSQSEPGISLAWQFQLMKIESSIDVQAHDYFADNDQPHRRHRGLNREAQDRMLLRSPVVLCQNQPENIQRLRKYVASSTCPNQNYAIGID